MFLSDERSKELVDHCHIVLRGRAKKLRILMTGCSTIPSVKKNSTLLWCPVLTKVNVFPIDEEHVFDEVEFGCIDIGRSLFYCELDSERWKEMKRRCALQTGRRRRRTRRFHRGGSFAQEA